MAELDVIIVGGGPSGLTCAAELAATGAATLVLERRIARDGARRAASNLQTRAGTIIPRVLELFDARGIADRFIDKAREIVEFPFREGHIWAGFSPVEWRYLESRFGYTLGLPQNITEQLLEDWAYECGAQIRYGAEVVSVSSTETGVQAEVVDPSGNSSTLTARYLIGADGGRSVVRTSAGFGWEGAPGSFRAMGVDAEIPSPWPSGRMNAVNERGWVRGYAFGDGITRFNIIHRDTLATPKEVPVTLDEVLKCIRDVHGTDYGIKSFRDGGRVDAAMYRVPSFQKGNIFLVGESARTHYPASGVGMQFCIQDAFNLGWKMGNVIRGLSADSTLNSYDEERLPVMNRWLESVDTQCALQFRFDKEGNALKRFVEELLQLPDFQRKLVGDLNGLEFPYAVPVGSHRLAGGRMPDIDVVTPEGGVLRTGELLRGQMFVLLDLEGYSRQFDAIDCTGFPVRVVKARMSNPPDELIGVSALLIRPDSYVAWASDSVSSGAGAVIELRRWLHHFPLIGTDK